MTIDESLRMRSDCNLADFCGCICKEMHADCHASVFWCGYLCRAAGGSELEETFVQVKRCFSQQEQRKESFQTESRPAWVPAAPVMRIFYHSFDNNQRVDAVVSGFQNDPPPLESLNAKVHQSVKSVI